MTSFEFVLHELSVLPILSCFHTFDDAHALLRLAESTMSAPDVPDELLWTSFVRKAPLRPWMSAELVWQPGVMSVIEWSGDPDAGMQLLHELSEDVQPACGSVDLIPFSWIQTAGDDDFGPGLRS